MTSMCTPQACPLRGSDHSVEHGMRVGWAFLLLAVAGLMVPAFASAADMNVVGSVAVEESADETRILIEGTREPTFTVFKLEEPPRLVVDMSRTDVSGVDRLLEVNRGNVKAVITTSFENDGARMGRVMVVLEQDAQYDVRGRDEGVVVSVAIPDGLAPVGEGVVAEKQVAEPAPVMANAQPVEPVTDSTADEASPEARPKDAPPKMLRRVETAASSNDLPEGVVARKIDRLDEAERAGERVKAVRASDSAGMVRISIVTDGAPREIELLELSNPPRLALDFHGITQAPRRADTRGLSARSPVKDVRIGEHEDMIRVVVDARGTTMPRYDMRRNDRGILLEVGEASEQRSEVVSTGSTPARTTPKAASKTEARASIRGVTYTRLGETGRVQVDLDDAGSVRYELERPDSRTAVLAIEGATVHEDLERTFDASHFGGEVRAISVFKERGESSKVKVVASLSRSVETRVSPSDNGLVWEFALSPTTAASDSNEGHVSISSVGAYEGDETDEDIPVITAAGLATEGAQHVTSDGERQARRYTGRRITIELRDVDIHNVLRLITEVSRKNLVVADDVSGRVTLRLRNVPWDQALDLVLRAKGLDKEEEGNIIRVAPAERLAAERRARREAAEARVALEPLRVRLIPVNFATASDMASKASDVLTERGTVTVDARTNSLIVKDIVDALVRVEQLVRRLDTETPQVLIESRIVEANVNFARDIGVQWGGNITFSQATGNPTGLAFPNIVSMGGAADDGRAPTAGTSPNPNFAVNMPAPIGMGSGGGLGFVFGSAGGIANLNLRLSAMEQEGVIKTISSPRIQTLDNQQATISQGLSIPYSQVSAAGTNTVFMQAQLQLNVTPHVTADGSILMNVQVTNNQPHPDVTGAGGQPSISQKEATTNVMVRDGETMVIGGIYTRSNSETFASVPGLGRIPVVGWLFKKRIVRDERTELLVFITPRIINRQEGLPTTLN